MEKKRKPRIFTSYYGKVKELRSHGIVPISISLKSPEWFNGLSVRDFAPEWSFMKLPKEEYKKAYFKKLNSIDISIPLRHIKSIAGDNDIALLCFESLKTDRSDDWCHRTMLAEWFKKNQNFIIKEFITQKDIDKAKKERDKKKLIDSQGSLF